jgi:hypothetical protein
MTPLPRLADHDHTEELYGHHLLVEDLTNGPVL